LRAKRYVESHAHKHISLNEIAAQLGISRYYLSRSFTKLYGVTPLAYHLSLRMTLAKSLLATPHLSVSEVAARVGYGSVSAFSRSFQREVGVTPTQYREEWTS